MTGAASSRSEPHPAQAYRAQQALGLLDGPVAAQKPDEHHHGAHGNEDVDAFVGEQQTPSGRHLPSSVRTAQPLPGLGPPAGKTKDSQCPGEERRGPCSPAGHRPPRLQPGSQAGEAQAGTAWRRRSAQRAHPICTRGPLAARPSYNLHPLWFLLSFWDLGRREPRALRGGERGPL